MQQQPRTTPARNTAKTTTTHHEHRQKQGPKTFIHDGKHTNKHNAKSRTTHYNYSKQNMQKELRQNSQNTPETIKRTPFARHGQTNQTTQRFEKKFFKYLYTITPLIHGAQLAEYWPNE